MSKYETRWGDAGVYHEDFIKAEKEAKKNGLGFGMETENFL